MADLYMDVDTALSEVPVNLLPLLDDSDFKTIEDAVAYNAAGMALYWHFVTTAGAYSVTAVTPTSGGAYDWTDQGAAGIYTIEIPASGGASINNDTEGFGWFTGMATGVLPWRGPVICFRAAALNDADIDGGDLRDVNVTQVLGVAAQNGYDPQSQITATGSPTTTSVPFTTGSLSAQSNAFKDRYLVGATGANAGTMRRITASSDSAGTTTLTTKAFPTAPSADDIFLITNVDPLGEVPGEPSGVFAWASGTVRDIIAWLGVKGSNKVTTTSSTLTVRNRADNASLATATVSDDGTTAVKGSES